MASFHFASLIHQPTTEVRHPQLWQRLREWIKLTRTLFSEHELEKYGLGNTEAEVGPFDSKIYTLYPVDMMGTRMLLLAYTLMLSSPIVS